MALNANNRISRSSERFFLFVSSIVIGILFYQLYQILQQDFKDVSKRLANGTMMDLNQGNPGEHIKTLLEKGFYFKDKRDIDLIGTVVTNGRRNAVDVVDNVGELNKSNYNVSVEEAWVRGGEVFKKRVQVEKS